MKAVILSDIHGNLPALEKILNEEKNADLYIVLGDVVNYGPWSNECVQLLDQLENKFILKGNHEDFFIQNYCNSKHHLSSLFFKVCIKNFKEVKIISNYLKNKYFDKYFCCHTIKNQYIFKDSDVEINKNYIIGHSHQQYKIKRGSNTIINPGSVGQNRAYINEINYATIETKYNKLKFKKLIYNVEYLISEMKKKRYPKLCIDYYNFKKRR